MAYMTYKSSITSNWGKMMQKVTILAMYNTMASTVIGPMDVFYQAGVLWNYFNGQNLTPYFEVKVVTTNGAPFKCLSGARMIPDGSIYDVQESDLIVVVSGEEFYLEAIDIDKESIGDSNA